MFRVLIVDDEQEIINGLKLKVEWDSIGLQIVGEAGNGVAALEFLENHAVDIVLTDMNMPVMNGSAFLDYCKEQYPGIKVIVLTGYDDFEYARAAVRGNARDYLLKPIMSEELTEVLQRVKLELDNEREKYKKTTATEWKLSMFLMEMCENFVLRIAKGETNFNIQNRAELFHMNNWEHQSVSFLTLGLRQSINDETGIDRVPQLYQFPFELICREIIELTTESSILFKDNNYPNLLHIISLDNEMNKVALTDKLREIVSSKLRFELVIGSSLPVCGYSEWNEGYMGALLSWNMEVSHVQNSEIKLEEGQLNLQGSDIQALKRMHLRGEMSSFKDIIEIQLQEAYRQSKSSFVKSIFQLFLVIEGIAHETNASLSSAQQIWLRPEFALSLDTIEKANVFLMEIANHIHQHVVNAEVTDEQSVIKKAQSFIDDNYMYEITLPMLAEKYNYNPSYFSELFKSKVGKTYVQYITEVRMKHACKLLEESNLGLWDIAELTGFSNPSYFSSKFKKVFGISPTDYRQRLPRKNDSTSPKK
ncbi:response regulator transcription factor [Paenibacillus sp. FA6]|uniref:response regulator transcription factor n=1 Tax=Paenibacillus sp. FA6 TaxID=3413029 RepID=UPI003F65CDFB